MHKVLVNQGTPHNGSKEPTPFSSFHHPKYQLEKKVTYANFITDIRPLKEKTRRLIIIVVEDRLDYDDPSSPAVSLWDTKIMINSVISDASKGVRFCTTDKNFYLNNPMERYRYMKIPIKYITEEIMREYNLQIVTSGVTYMWKYARECTVLKRPTS